MADPQVGGTTKLVRATVAPGRTVVIGGGALTNTVDGKQVVVGHKRGKSFGPLQEVSLPHEDVVRLRKSGALIDPDKAAAPGGSSAVVRR